MTAQTNKSTLKPSILLFVEKNIPTLDLEGKIKAWGYNLSALVFTAEEAMEKAAQLSPDLALAVSSLENKKENLASGQQMVSLFKIPLVFLILSNGQKKGLPPDSQPDNSSVLLVADKKDLKTALENAFQKKDDNAQLAECELKYQGLFEKSNDLIQILDKNARILDVNQKWIKALGYTKEEAKTKTIWDILRRDHRSCCEQLFKETLDGQTKQNVEAVFIAKNGEEIWVSGNASPVYKDKKLVYVQGIFKNITECVNKGRAVKANEEKYRVLTENLPNKIFIKDKNSVYVSCNKRLADDLKIKPDKIAGKTDYDFFPSALADKYRQDDKRIIASGQTESIEEKYVAEGKETWVHTIKAPLKDDRNRIIGIIGSFVDITRQMEIRQEDKKHLSELEKFNKIAVGRELKMVELKKRIAQLEQQLGKKNDAK